MKRSICALVGLLLCLGACSEEVDGTDTTSSTTSTTSTSSGGDGGEGGGSPLGPNESALTVDVPDEGRAYVSLRPLSVVTEADGPTAWDLAFEGDQVFTNGGASGPGEGAAFGPLDPETFTTGEIPSLPFMMNDEAGGPFVDWYKYDGVTHALWARYHVYGVRDGERLYKVQILGYYGDVGGAPVSALYRLRYAEVTSSGIGATKTLTDVDATGSGATDEGDSAAACLDLSTGVATQLTIAQAQASSAWHLCFRRDRVNVNGGLSGSRGVTAVDLDGAKTEAETLDEVTKRTAESELGRFDAVNYAKLSDPKLAYRADAIRSAFTDQWLVKDRDPLAPVAASWVVIDALGDRHLVKIPRFHGATSSSPVAVEVHEKPAP